MKNEKRPRGGVKPKMARGSSCQRGAWAVKKKKKKKQGLAREC